MIVSAHNFRCQIGGDVGPVGVEIAVQVMLEHVGENVKLSCGRVVDVSFGLGYLAQFLDGGLAHLVIVEAGRVDRTLEIGVNGVGDHEILGRTYCRMFGRELVGVVKGPVVAHYIVAVS
ncbi:MAG: hypothetical protein K2K92_02660 [Duncaniella sp.]|nr:hypothetical protein [Duncaniella sp.]